MNDKVDHEAAEWARGQFERRRVAEAEQKAREEAAANQAKQQLLDEQQRQADKLAMY